MTEEQFWHSNPEIIKVWEKAWRLEENHKNEMVHLWVGTYGISALSMTIDHCFNKHARSKYVEKPIQLFETTEEDKKIEALKARQAFMAWAGMAKKNFNKKGGE